MKMRPFEFTPLFRRSLGTLRDNFSANAQLRDCALDAWPLVVGTAGDGDRSPRTFEPWLGRYALACRACVVDGLNFRRGQCAIVD